jgi:hypothetical protein
MHHDTKGATHNGRNLSLEENGNFRSKVKNKKKGERKDIW